MKYNEAKLEIWNSDSFMLAMDEMKDCYDGPRNVALDLGAHVGTRAIWLATNGGFKRVFAVEMEIENYMLLCKNIERNKLGSIITPILAAVTAEHDLRPIYFAGPNHGQFSIAYDEKNFQRRAGWISTTPLATLIDKLGCEIDFCKMDIEGSEYELFASFKTRAAFANWVRFLFLERHGPNADYFSDKFFDDLGYDPKDPQKQLFDHLKWCGFDEIRENAIGQLMMYNAHFKREARAA